MAKNLKPDARIRVIRQITATGHHKDGSPYDIHIPQGSEYDAEVKEKYVLIDLPPSEELVSLNASDVEVLEEA